MLTVLCNIPAVNRMICLNQSLLALFLCRKTLQVHHLLVGASPKVGIYEVTLYCKVGIADVCLCFYISILHAY